MLAIIAFAGGSAARSQVFGPTGSRTNSTDEGTKRPSARYVTRTKTVPVTKIKMVTPTTGTLAVAAEPNAEILVEPIGAKRGVGRVGTVPGDESLFIFNDLKPGRYRVAAALKGYQPDERLVVVTANKSLPVTLNLQPITYTFTFNVNVSTGEVRYAVKGGPPQVAPIKDGHATLTNLHAGKYDVEILPGEVGYEPFHDTFTLPGKTNSFDATLKRLTSTATFSEPWTNLDRWDAPGSWRVASRKLTVIGQGVALPRDEAYRYYKDFQLSSDVRMLNGVAVSFVVRAVDKLNYYLIQLTGPNADEPYVLRGFVVKGGVPQSLQAPIPIDAFTATINSDQFINVLLTMKENKLHAKIRDNQTGELVSLGILTDPARNFQIGAVGIAGNNEQNEIWRFIVCTPECPKE